MNKEKLSQKDYELINSYLDQELDRKDVISFSRRMAENAEIREEIADLMQVKAMVKELPTVTPPRNYILTRAMAEEARPKPWWERLFPVFRTAAAFCALALAFTFIFPLIQAQQSVNNKKTDTAYFESSAVENTDHPAPTVTKSVSQYDRNENMDYAEPPVAKSIPQNDPDWDMDYEADSMAAEEMDYAAAPAAKSVFLLDEEIVLEDRSYGGAAEESYRAVMPSYGVRGGNPRIEYMMRQEENQRLMNEQSAASEKIPDGYISVEEAQQAVRSTAMKIIFGGGLLMSAAVLFILHKRRKALEVS